MYFATQTTAFIYILRYKTLNTQRKSTISTTNQLECYLVQAGQLLVTVDQLHHGDEAAGGVGGHLHQMCIRDSLSSRLRSLYTQ